MLIYKKMSVLDVPSDGILIQSCNIEGKWDSGVAKALKEFNPKMFIDYQEYCKYSDLGTYDYYDYDEFGLVNLYVSNGDSQNPDDPYSINFYTGLALNSFFNSIIFKENFYMPKINSGGFKVNWEETEKLLTLLCKRYMISITICDPNMKEE
jgi:hypothetical protein